MFYVHRFQKCAIRLLSEMSVLHNFHKQLGKGIDYRKNGDKFGVGVSTACKKGNTAGTEENLFRLVLVPRYDARVLPPELVPFPGRGAQITARAPTKGYVQTGTRAWRPGTGTKSERGLSSKF